MDQITVSHDASDRFTIRIRGHEVVVDQPASGDAGPTPTELFVASLAACAGFYARRFLARHGLDDGGLVIGCDYRWAPDHSRVEGITLRLDVPGGVAPALEPALRRAIEHCTVHQSIREQPVIEYAINALQESVLL